MNDKPQVLVVSDDTTTRAAMMEALQDYAPVAAKTLKDAETAVNAGFRSQTKVPKGADRNLCARAVGRIVLQHQNVGDATFGLTKKELGFVLAVVEEVEAWKGKQEASTTAATETV